MIRVHKAPDVQRFNAVPVIIERLSQADEEWSIYDAMGVSPGEAYTISKSLVVPSAALPLPEELNI